MHNKNNSQLRIQFLFIPFSYWFELNPWYSVDVVYDTRGVHFYNIISKGMLFVQNKIRISVGLKDAVLNRKIVEHNM